MIEAYKRFWVNIFNFSGTADRPSYWWPVIINWILGGVIVAIIQLILGHPMTEIYNWTGVGLASARNIVAFLVWIATLAVSIRRLHDTDRSGWWYLIQLIPVIGWLWFLVLMLLPSKTSRWR